MDSDSDSDDDKPSDYTWVLPILLLGVAAQRQEQPQGLARLYILAMPGICKLIEVVVRVASDVGSLSYSQASGLELTQEAYCLAIVENREDAVYIQVIYKLHREVFGVLACPNHEALDDLDPPSRISKLTTWRAQVVNFRLGLGGPKSVCQTGP